MDERDIYMRKFITDLRQISEDLRYLAEQFPNLSKTVMVDTITDIGKESFDECPKDTLELCFSWEVEIIYEYFQRLCIAFGYTDPKAYWVHEIPPPMSGARTLGWNPYNPGRYPAKAIMTLFGAMGIANDKMLASVNIGCRTNWHAPPTKWKFLEDPVNRNIDLFPERLADEVDDLIMRHGTTMSEWRPGYHGLIVPEAPETEAGYADWGE